MTIKVSLITLLVVLCLISGCNPIIDLILQTECEDALDAQLDLEFKLQAKESACIESEGLKITLVDILEDSRCPIDVNCFWEGQVKVQISIYKDGKELGELTLTDHDTNTGSQSENIHNYRVTLTKVEPLPVSDREIQLSDYHITLLVTKIDDL